MRSKLSHSKTELSESIFHRHCKTGDLVEIANLLKKNPEYLDQQDRRLGFTPLAHAVVHAKLDVVRFLLKKGANPNLQDYIGESPLHLAAENSYVEITEVLLNSKAEPNCSTIDGETPLHHAAFKGDIKIIALLLGSGADPNSADITLGRTPLHCAVKCEHFECVNLLIRYGANPTLEDKEGNSPLFACQNSEILKVLNDWQEKTTKNLISIPEVGVSEEEKNSMGYSFTQSLASVSFSFTESSFDSGPSEILPTQKYGNEDTTASFQEAQTIEDPRLVRFLKSIQLQGYKNNLVKAGFDDLEMMAYQMMSPLPITHNVLESIGMHKHGHRSRLLMKLEQNAGVCPIGRIEEKHSIDSSWECCQPTHVNLPGVNLLIDWLTLLKLEKYFKVLEQAGYEDLGFMCAQMNSRYPIDDTLLQKIGILKIGHRLRILGKLMEDSKNLNVKTERVKESCNLL